MHIRDKNEEVLPNKRKTKEKGIMERCREYYEKLLKSELRIRENKNNF